MEKVDQATDLNDSISAILDGDVRRDASDRDNFAVPIILHHLHLGGK